MNTGLWPRIYFFPRQGNSFSRPLATDRWSLLREAGETPAVPVGPNQNVQSPGSQRALFDDLLNILTSCPLDPLTPLTRLSALYNKVGSIHRHRGQTGEKADGFRTLAQFEIILQRIRRVRVLGRDE
jgi:hypothetical protein